MTEDDSMPVMLLRDGRGVYGIGACLTTRRSPGRAESNPSRTLLCAPRGI
jgi:hypothetical protein